MKNENTTVEILKPQGIQIEKGDELIITGTDCVFVASGSGFGCNPKTMGSAVFGHWKHNGAPDRVERYQVTGIIKAPNDSDTVEMERIAGRLMSLESSIDSLLTEFAQEVGNMNKIRNCQFSYELKDSSDELGQVLAAIVKHANGQI